MIRDLPEKLRALRTQQELSQKDVAYRLGISPSVVSAYELGERTPSTEVILAIAALYHCSTDYLLGRDNKAPAAVLDVDGLSDAQIHALQQLIQTMKDEGK